MANPGRRKKNTAPVPVIDLFAGPGGLGEGFSSLPGPGEQQAFKIHLSIEKDSIAHETLELRAFFRQFPPGKVPEDYYRFLRQEISRAELFNSHREQAEAAKAEAWRCTLGVETAAAVREKISAALGGADRWVLIGGPPCQAYSLVGRSRNMGIKNYDLATDPRQKLYVDYLQVIADHAPAVFVMENVKGLLSAKVKDARIFEKILSDLRSPCEAILSEGRTTSSASKAPKYRLHSLNPNSDHLTPGILSPQDFVVRAERHGVPQARHRLILVGIREDIDATPGHLQLSEKPTTLSTALAGLPRLRSGLSGELDGAVEWKDALRSLITDRCHGIGKDGRESGEVFARIHQVLQKLRVPANGRGGEYIPTERPNDFDEGGWYIDPRIGGVCNHSTRSHMRSDLYRYLFAACFAQVNKRPPSLSDFPNGLLPKHENVDRAIATGHFSDRFRVQLPDRASTTITSHISKDGHYYIHYDPAQCRSLTVREAARLQTFPDNYFFCGGRTAQYTQVGNAVPPLLARGIAEVVYNALKE